MYISCRMAESLDLDKQRKSYELPHHWKLRKEFLQVHSDKFDAERLICLSNVFVYVECMGVKYPKEVMDLVKELGKSVKGLEYYRYELEKDEPQLPRRSSNNRQHSFNARNNRSFA